MQFDSIRTATVLISLMTVGEIVGVILLNTDLRREDPAQMLRVLLLLSFPALLVGGMGLRKSGSQAVPGILFTSSLFSLTLWFLVLAFASKPGSGDFWSGLRELFSGFLVFCAFVIQLGILSVTTLCCLGQRTSPAALNDEEPPPLEVATLNGLRQPTTTGGTPTRIGSGFQLILALLAGLIAFGVGFYIGLFCLFLIPIRILVPMPYLTAIVCGIGAAWTVLGSPSND